MFKKLLLIFSLISFNISAAVTFEIDESNSVNKLSLLKIEEVKNYFRFNISVLQSNNWKFRRDIHLISDNLEKKLKAEFVGNTITFTLNEEQFLNLMEGEYLHINTFLNYQDSFYIPNFRNLEFYEKLKIEKYKNDFIENQS